MTVLKGEAAAALALLGQRLDAVRSADDGFIDHFDEEAMIDNPMDGFDPGGEAGRVGDRAEVDIQDVVVVIGDVGGLAIRGEPEDRAATERFELLLRESPAERDDLDRYRDARPDCVNQLGIVRDDHFPQAGDGHELLAKQRATPAFEDREGARQDLIGAIDRQIDPRDVLDVGQRDSERAC